MREKLSHKNEKSERVEAESDHSGEEPNMA